MAKATVHFKKCIQDSQELGSTDEHMVSRVYFDLDVDGVVQQDMCVDVKQLVGGNFETDPLEVSRPDNVRGAFNYAAFRGAVEKYYRSLVGSEGSGIRVSGGASNIRMRNNTFISAATVQFEIGEGTAGW